MAMQSIGQLAHHATQPQGEHDQQASSTVRKLFLILQGTYGTPFLSKYSTGVMDDSKPPRDKGMVAAIRVWDRALSKFAPDVIETAANRVTEAHKQFPPNLAEFEALCRAAAPRKSHAELQGWTALPAPAKPNPVEVQIDLVGDGKDGYRKIWARYQAGDRTISRYALEAAMQVLGIKKGKLA